MANLTPYLAVHDARAAIDWYVEHLGAVVTFDPIVMPDGHVGHVELAVDGAGWMMSEEYPDLHVQAPAPDRGASVSLHLALRDGPAVDALVERAVAGGAVLDRGPEDNPPVGRVAVVRDPFGHRWFLNGAL